MKMNIQTLEYKGGTVSFYEAGSGTALLLLHGFLENKTMWQELTLAWSQKFRVIAIDLLGHGDSDCLGYVHTMEDQAMMVQAVLSHLKIRRIHLVGHSMGGYVALAFAEMYPNYIKSLVLQNSTSLADSDERKKNRLRAIKAVKQNAAGFIRLAVSNLFALENHEILANEIENARNEAVKTPLQGVIAALEGMRERKDRTFVLQNASFPKLVILGKKDAVLDFESNQNIVDAADLVVLDGGHMSHLENKNELAHLILEFFLKSR